MKRLTVVLTLLAALFLPLTGCAGGGGDGDGGASSNWDELVWDLDDWA